MPRTSAKPAAKKAAAKKTVSRRRTNKVEISAEIEVPTTPMAEANEDMVGKSDLNTEGSFKDLFFGLLDAPQKPCPAEQLKNIAVIDLRGVSFFGRFQVVTLLQNAGYSFLSNMETPMTDAVHYYQYSEVFLLNHHNKLVTPNSWEAGKKSDAISKVESAYAYPDVAFSAPVPEFVEVDGELFARVK